MRQAGSDVDVMRRDDEREVELALEGFDQVEDAPASVRVQVPGRLVAQQQLGLLRERAGERDALRLAAGQLGGQVVGLRVEAHEGEQLERVGVPARDRGGERDVLEGREVGEEVCALEDVGDPVRADGITRGGVECRERRALPLDRARGRLDQPTERVQQGRLAGARAAEQRDTVACAEAQCDPVQCLDGGVSFAVDDCRPRGRRRASCDRPVSHLDHAVRSLGDPLRVRDHDDGCAVTVAQVPQRLEHDALTPFVELGRRLVGEQERRLARGGGSDRDALLLSAGKASCTLRGARPEPERDERALRLSATRLLPASRNDSAMFSEADRPG